MSNERIFAEAEILLRGTSDKLKELFNTNLSKNGYDTVEYKRPTGLFLKKKFERQVFKLEYATQVVDLFNAWKLAGVTYSVKDSKTSGRYRLSEQDAKTASDIITASKMFLEIYGKKEDNVQLDKMLREFSAIANSKTLVVGAGSRLESADFSSARKPAIRRINLNAEKRKFVNQVRNQLETYLGLSKTEETKVVVNENEQVYDQGREM